MGGGGEREREIGRERRERERESDRKRGWGRARERGGRERRGKIGHTINELCIIVLLNSLKNVLSYFISFRARRNGAQQMNYV